MAVRRLLTGQGLGGTLAKLQAQAARKLGYPLAGMPSAAHRVGMSQAWVAGTRSKRSMQVSAMRTWGHTCTAAGFSFNAVRWAFAAASYCCSLKQAMPLFSQQRAKPGFSFRAASYFCSAAAWSPAFERHAPQRLRVV